jgi:uncharacterized protein YjbI with pentapeptide repeats
VCCATSSSAGGASTWRPSPRGARPGARAFEDCTLAQSDLQDARLAAVVWRDCDLREIDLGGVRLGAACELRGCVLDGARGVERLRGARMPYADVLAAATTFAGALAHRDRPRGRG